MSDQSTDQKAVAIARAQAQRSLGNVLLTLFASVSVAVSLALLLYYEDGRTNIVWWLATVTVLSLIRAGLTLWLKSTRLAEREPRRVLRILTSLAFASGVLWSVVPFAYDAFGETKSVEAVAFIMAGVTIGAIIQSVAYSPIALAFGAPLMTTMLVRSLISLEGVSYVIAFDLALLTLMLFRAALLGEGDYRQSQSNAFEATELANSLASSNQALEVLARTDPLTGLANRTRFHEIGSSACCAGNGVALVSIDVDYFKSINDTRGHDTGDRVIRLMAELLRSHCTGDDLPFRLGGDEFVVVLRNGDVDGRANALAERLINTLKSPITIAGHSFQISCSIGIASQVAGEIDLEDLFTRADVALYRAKDDGRGCVRLFDEQMHSDLAVQRCIDLELPGALQRGDLYVEFQPQVVMATQEVTGFEALLRWQHPGAGRIAPPDIVDAAIRLRLSDKLTGFVCERACGFLVALDAVGAANVKVAINVSPREFLIHSPARTLMAVAQRFDVGAERIEIEITEEALFDPKQCASEIERIRQCGFGLAIDDFGVGHSSISNLMAVELDTIKIDRSFVHGITSNLQNQQLVGAIAAVSLPLGHRIIAEGVETEEEARLLRMLGCRHGQGWYYARPMTEKHALDWLVARLRGDERPAVSLG